MRMYAQMVTSIHPKIPPASKISGRWLDQKETIHIYHIETIKITAISEINMSIHA